jgi:hypothetical protein
METNDMLFRYWSNLIWVIVFWFKREIG